MRTDHFAYQQATRVASFGLLLQVALGLLLLVFGVVWKDTTFLFASGYVLIGTIVWTSLTIVFHQHRLERIETLEADQIAAGRDSESVFSEDENSARVAARRLDLMHTWMLPLASLLVLLALGGTGIWGWRWLRDQASMDTASEAGFQITDNLGWALALALGAALISFIFSRFVAGMAKQRAWQNLRGGAGWMVGNAIVMVALAAGIGFEFTGRSAVISAVAFGITVFMIVAAAEILLNLILNLYRPRRVGEVPRAAFDSPILSRLAAPDSIVRSINEAVNYQFGFDITSSWGYQLLLRSFTSLVAIGVLVMVLMSCAVVVGPDQQALRLRFGAMVSEHGPGLMLKLPWPIETAQLHTVERIQRVAISLNPDMLLPPERRPRVNTWVIEDSGHMSRRLFITGASRLAAAADAPSSAEIERELEREGDVDVADARIGAQFALVDADIELQYRVRRAGLQQHVDFAGDARARYRGPNRELGARHHAVRTIASREVTEFLARTSIEDVLSPAQSGVLDRLRGRIQERFDSEAYGLGIEVVAVTMPALRPPMEAAQSFEELSISRQSRRELRENAERSASTTMTVLAGSVEEATRIVDRIDAMEAMRRDGDVEGALRERAEIERMIVETRTQTASVIALAETRRWLAEMHARSNANRILGEHRLYSLAPELYRQRRTMEVIARTLPNARQVFIVGLPADRVHFDVTVQEADPGFSFLDAVE